MITASRGLALGVALAGVSAVSPAVAFDLDSAQQAAVFKAAGFTARNNRQVRCDEDPPTLSYRPGSVEAADLNGDGRPEAWVKEGSLFCYGNTGEFFVLLAQDHNGDWKKLLEGVGVPVELEARHHGWPDLMVGGPGNGAFPVYAFDGQAYVRK